jgi:hypothetical protein
VAFNLVEFVEMTDIFGCLSRPNFILLKFWAKKKQKIGLF